MLEGSFFLLAIQVSYQQASVNYFPCCMPRYRIYAELISFVMDVVITVMLVSSFFLRNFSSSFFTQIRLQLETLLAEKGRLAHENSVYARENRFLREIVEYHQLTMQDVVYVDEGIEEVTEVFSNSPNQILSRTSSLSNSSHGTLASLEHSSPATPVPATSATRPPAIVVPEACPVIPMPPKSSPHVSSGMVSPNLGANLHSPMEGEDGK